MKLLQSPLLWFALVVLIGIGIGIGVALNVGRRRLPGFLDYVMNPQLLNEFEEAARAADEYAETASSWSDAQIAAEVRQFVFDTESSEDAWAEAQALRSLGSRTHPVLLEILRKPSLHSKLVVPTGKDSQPEAPFNRLCELLGEAPPVESAELLARYLDEPSDEIRKDAALAIGCTGAASAIPSIRKALGDSNEYVRSYALMGLERARERGHLSDACGRELFADLKQMLAEGKNADHAAGLLLHFDRQRAVDFILSDEIFNPKCKSLHDLIRAINAKGLTIPRGRLLPLISQVDSVASNYPHNYQLGELLQALGNHQVAEDRVLLEKYVSHAKNVVAEGAAEGLLSLHGISGFKERLWRKADEQGLTSLTDPQRYYLAVLNFDSEVNNGGLSQYFFNSSGDEWKSALSGLEAMESKERFAVLSQALSKFGAGGPDKSRESRMRQLSKLARADEDLFNDLDKQYYASTEVVEVLAMRYVLKNREAFR